MSEANLVNPETANAPESKKRSEYFVSRICGSVLIETIASPEGYVQFARCAGRTVEVLDSIETETSIWLPDLDIKAFLDTNCLFLPSRAHGLSISTLELLEEIKAVYRRYSFTPEEWLETIALYVVMTWAYDRFTAVPYLRFLGEPGTGKTRLLEISAALSYRGFKVSGNITGPALFRSIEMLKGTIAIDEADFRDSEEWSDIIKVINCGYKTGIPVFRCEGFSHTPRPFYVYGPKIISTRQRFDDQATETRCLTFETQEVKLPAHIPYQLPMSFFHETLALRNRLLRWRFDNFFKVEARESELRKLAPRLGEIGASLCAVAPPGEVFQRLLAFLTTYDAVAKEGSDKAIVIQAMQQMRERGSQTATVGEIADEASELAKSIGKPELSARRVGGILRSALSLKPRHTKHGNVVDLPVGEGANL